MLQDRPRVLSFLSGGVDPAAETASVSEEAMSSHSSVMTRCAADSCPAALTSMQTWMSRYSTHRSLIVSSLLGISWMVKSLVVMFWLVICAVICVRCCADAAVAAAVDIAEVAHDCVPQLLVFPPRLASKSCAAAGKSCHGYFQPQPQPHNRASCFRASFFFETKGFGLHATPQCSAQSGRLGVLVQHARACCFCHAGRHFCHAKFAALQQQTHPEVGRRKSW